MTANQELLAQYVESGSEDAFRQLVGNYIDLVHSTALRLLGGDRHLAEDVTQTVFVHLCRNAGHLPRAVMLGGWLHRDTCYVASNLLRGERRRQAREQEVARMQFTPDHTPANLAAVAPILDEAINQLEEDDRAAILLRFFERMDFRAVGSALGSNEDAARMRVSRALDKLHGFLGRRGVTLSTAALATVLGGEVVSSAPTGLAMSVAAAALAGSVAAGSGASTIIKIMIMTKIKAGILGAVLVSGAAVPLWVQHQAQMKIREENQALRQQIQQLSAENERLQKTQASAADTATPEQERELLRLRGEVGNLRRQVAEAKQAQDRKPAAPSQAAAEARTPAEEEQYQACLAKMNYAKDWMLAFFMYSEKNQGQAPTNFEQAASFMPAEFKAAQEAPTNAESVAKFGLTPDKFEVLYQGALQSIKSPQSTIVIREKDAWQTTDGGWARAYGFADGHTEIHKAADGNFQPWETQRLVTAAAGGEGQ